MNEANEAQTFAQAASRATRRLVLVDWCALLARSAAPVFAGAMLLWFVLRRTGVHDEAWWAAALLVAWLGAVALVAWSRRLAPFDALAAWDRATGRREMFASALFFEQSATATPGAKLHLALAHASLHQERGQLARSFPLRPRVPAWLAPLAFSVFALSGWLRLPISTEDRSLSAAARTQAARVGADLAKRSTVLEPLKGLSEEEKKRLQHLQAQLEEAAKKLDRMETPRDLLEELERRARATEKLAEQLRTDDLGALSSPLLAELERNADTADLGSALRGEDLGRVAEEARLLAARLGQKKPTLEEEKRLEEALKRALGAMNEKDRRSKVGERLDEAQKQLAAGDRQRAAQQFGDLADRFDRAAQRQQAQNQLRDLAQSFRGAGGQILGGQNLQRLMPSAPAGTMPLPSFQLAPGQSPPGMMPMPGQSAPLALFPMPGAPPPGTPNGMLLFPIPGSGQIPGGQSPPIPGLGLNPGGAPATGAMIFPIPGAGGLIAGGAGVIPGSGAAGVGGSQAGVGIAPLGGDPTKPLDANSTGVVAPTPGAEGPSELRSVAGQAHREAATRSRTEIAKEFLKVEEAALADEPLPLSRRAQVLLYFTALRQQLEHQP